MQSSIQHENLNRFNALPLSTGQTSSLIQLKECVCYSAQIVWTGGDGSTAGTIILEGTNYPVADPTVTPIYSLILTNVVSTTSGDWLINIERAGYTHARIRWVPTGGATGTITAYTSSKRA